MCLTAANYLLVQKNNLGMFEIEKLMGSATIHPQCSHRSGYDVEQNLNA